SHTTHHIWRFRKSGRPTKVRISGFFFCLAKNRDPATQLLSLSSSHCLNINSSAEAGLLPVAGLISKNLDKFRGFI
ncbi:hypothetical protein ACKWMZ_16905, partial [Pseudomonas protegens]|uniref:hypothetical protein n=1 Tax=Pseudomonas protegens TaxID=380021 RepID=UPI0039676F2C